MNSSQLHLQVFSARHLFSGAKNSGDRGMVAVALSELVPGLHVVGGGPDSVKSLRWIDGYARAAKARETFIDDVRRGVVPHAADPACSFSVPIPATTVTLEDARSLKGSVVFALDCTASELVTLALGTRSRRCDVCGRELSVFRSASEALSDLVDNFRGESVVVELVGSAESAEKTVQTSGFALKPHIGGLFSAFIDSLAVDDRSFDRLRAAFETIWGIPETWIEISSPIVRRGYARTGFCAACTRLAPPIDREGISTTLRAGLEAEQNDPNRYLDVGGVTIGEILESPIHHVSGLLDRIAPRLARALAHLTELGLGNLPAGLNVKRHSSRARAVVALAASLILEGKERALLIDLPPLSLECSSKTPLHELLSIEALSRPVIVLGSGAPDGIEPIERAVVAGTGPSVAKLSLGRGHSVCLREGSCAFVHVDPQSANYDFTSAIARVLHGQQTGDPNVTIEGTPLLESQIISITPFNCTYSGRRMLIDELDFYDRVTRLYAASHGARVLGLHPGSFKRPGTRTGSGVCPECHGLGLSLIEPSVGDRPYAAVCPTCGGARFGPPLSQIHFKGQNLSELLDTTIEDSVHILRALPRAGDTLSLVRDLGLSSLPLGLPSALMSFSEALLMRIVQAILATKARTGIVILEEPFAGLNPMQARRLQGVLSELKGRSKAAYLLIERSSVLQ